MKGIITISFTCVEDLETILDDDMMAEIDEINDEEYRQQVFLDTLSELVREDVYGFIADSDSLDVSIALAD